MLWKQQRKAIILPRQARRDKQHGEDSNKTDRRVLFSALYDLLDATGQMCWDENRDYGAKYGSGVYAVAMRDMVKRDRNHASIIMWCVFERLLLVAPVYTGNDPFAKKTGLGQA